MFKNRSIQVKVVKDADEGESTTEETIKATIADPNALMKEATKGALTIAIAYVAADTARKVLINRLSK